MLSCVFVGAVCVRCRRSVVPTCRQPGRLSTSSSQAWPDVSMPNGAGGGGFVAAAAAAGQAVAEAAGGMEEDDMEAAAAAADGVVEMRQSSTG